ncbi:unnamed protein product [Menidia menidia]|uniref:(Atlantic silverside) hypothetical protein n=1 Tax=Menidia menidia TaxID=238744 RepID=A0A8S4BJP7_9TELE|nr:unnamed protein product [Menidia menidia]
MTLQNEQCRQICLFYLQIKMPPRITPLNDAIQHIISKRDKTFKLEVKYIDAVKGRGIFAKSSISKGEFVVEYKGDMINDAESQRRKKLYHSSCLAFMFAFKWKGKLWCIDASRDDGSFGRLINDEHRRPNCRMKKIDVNGNPHLCLFALNDIKEGEEITYDYGGEDCPWRTKVTIAMAQSQAVDESLPVPLPKIPTSDSSQSDCPEQIVTECQSECFVPRLRRTKSVFMKDIDLEDPSELYDSASSGDEYVPVSAGSDGDESCGRRSSQALFDMINLSVSVGSPVCDSTTQDNMPLDLVGETCEFVEEEEPCSRRISEFHGKNLDEITIEPHERALESDEDGQSQENYPSTDGYNTSHQLDEPSTEESVLSEVMLPTPSRKRKLSSQPSSTSAVLDDAPSRPSVRKPSTEESGLSEVMLPTPSRKRKLSSQPSSTSAVLDDAPSRPSVRTLSGKATQKKSPWTQTEIGAVERHLMKFISSCMVPGKWECERTMPTTGLTGSRMTKTNLGIGCYKTPGP